MGTLKLKKGEGVAMLLYGGEKTMLQSGDIVFFDAYDLVIGFFRNGKSVGLSKWGESADIDDKLYCGSFNRKKFSSIVRCIGFLFGFEMTPKWYSSPSRIGYTFTQTSTKHYDADIALRTGDMISFDDKTKVITLLRSKMVLDVDVECSAEAFDFMILLAHISNVRLRVILTGSESFSAQFFE